MHRLFESVGTPNASVIDSPEARVLAREGASQGIVLLRDITGDLPLLVSVWGYSDRLLVITENKGGFLPLRQLGPTSKIAVLGLLGASPADATVDSILDIVYG